jgi:hypothetical protein
VQRQFSGEPVVFSINGGGIIGHSHARKKNLINKSYDKMDYKMHHRRNVKCKNFYV